MRAFFFINRRSELTDCQTTTLLATAFLAHDVPVWIAEVDGLSLASRPHGTRFFVQGTRIPNNCRTTSAVVEQAGIGEVEAMELRDDDLLAIRTNPGRDLSRAELHATFLNLTQIAQHQGLRIWNSPSHLAFFASKAALSLLPETHRPAMLVTSAVEEIVEFVRLAPDDTIVKPNVGSRGAHVIRLQADLPNLFELVKSAVDRGPVVAQHFVRSQRPGDRRIVVLDGQVLEHAGHIAGIARVPASGDFRGNLHAGGTAHPVTLNPQDRAAVTQSAQILHEFGIRLAGIDLVEDKVIEFNVFSTGGLFDANRFADFDFAHLIVRRLIG